MIAELLPYPRRFAIALRFARLARPFAGILPARLRNLIVLATGKRATGEILPPGIYPADGVRKMRVALLPSCAQQALDRNINAATIRLLQRHGCEVVVAAGVGCCGALPLHMGRDAQGKALARANVAAWSAELANGLDAIVINASGCGTTVKDYAHVVGGETARRIGALARDVTELLVALGLRKGRRRALSRRLSRRLLAAARPTRDCVSRGRFWCEQASTFSTCPSGISAAAPPAPTIFFSRTSRAALGERKAAHIDSVDPDIVAAGNLGCMVQIARFAQAPVVHTVELLDWATGGPMPAALRDKPLRKPAPRAGAAAAGEAAGAPPAADPNPAGIW